MREAVELTITEVARQSGLRASAIRYYERVGLLPRAARVGGRRRYHADILRRLAFLQAAQTAGFSLAEMLTLFQELQGDAPLSARWQSLARRKLAEVETLIYRAEGMKRMLELGLQCTCADLEECMDCVLKTRVSRSESLMLPQV